MNKVKVIGIDPAPSKESTVFDGKKFENKNYKELSDYLKNLKETDLNVLICWDAPLSFSIKKNTTPFSKRIIEKYFSRQDGYKTPEGISIMGYSTCPHWTISQYLLGYPAISNDNIIRKNQFDLKFDKKKISKSITEVHPAVAIWIWCLDNNIKDWKYKKSKKSFETILSILKSKSIISEDIIIANDDQLDAYIAWKLGSEWVKNTGKVKILGDNISGSFLLPFHKGIFDKFKKFQEQNPSRHRLS